MPFATRHFFEMALVAGFAPAGEEHEPPGGGRATRADKTVPMRTRNVYLGIRPTFETGRGLLVEAYLIDFDGDLYGRTLRIAFISRLRGERRFPGVEELVAQMHRDVEAATELCASFTN
jgi:FAD synthase